jgi:hypothetical protein
LRAGVYLARALEAVGGAGRTGAFVEAKAGGALAALGLVAAAIRKEAVEAVLGAGEATTVGEKGRALVTEGAADVDDVAGISPGVGGQLAGVAVLKVAREAALHCGVGCVGLVVPGLALSCLGVAVLIDHASTNPSSTFWTDSALVAVLAIANLALEADLFVCAAHATLGTRLTGLVSKVETIPTGDTERLLLLVETAIYTVYSGAGGTNAITVVVAILALGAGVQGFELFAVGQPCLACSVVVVDEAWNAVGAKGGVEAG